MVFSGAGAVEELEASAGAVGGADDHAFEFLGGDETGAGAGDEDSAGFDEVEGELVEVFVFFAAAVFVLAIHDEFWGVEHDDFPFAFVTLHLAGIGEGVAVDPIDACLIEVGVAFGLGDGFFVQVDAGDIGGFALEECGESEASGVAAEVEHGAAGGPLGEEAAVVALVAEEAGFVTVAKVDFIAHAVLADFDTTDVIRLDFLEWNPFTAGDVLIDFDDRAGGAELLVEEGEPAFEAEEDAIAMDTDTEDIVEAINDEAAQGIAV
ncbi:MAG: hypothetical protein RI897_3717 [Verrucomicrobiota bacterium]